MQRQCQECAATAGDDSEQHVVFTNSDRFVSLFIEMYSRACQQVACIGSGHFLSALQHAQTDCSLCINAIRV